MSMFPNQTRIKPIQLEYGTDDKALFTFFNAVYAWMALGLAVTAAAAYFFYQTQYYRVFQGGSMYIVMILLGTWALAYAAQKVALEVSAALGTVLFLIYAALIGALISPIFLIYSQPTLGTAFLVTGGVFGVTSLYGFITKRDMTSMGSYLFMAVIGLIIASVVNVFWANDALSWIITYAILFVFIGITAYHTQRLKNFALEHGNDPVMAPRFAIYGSIVLYISFINMFMSILRILGSRR